MTYRVGNHWGVTIVREGERTPEGHIIGADQLVAVVVNGDRELAERICALLNAYMPSECTRVGQHNCDGEWRNHDRYEPPTPDVTHGRGAAEALARIRQRLTHASKLGEPITDYLVWQILRETATELGVDEDGPSGPPAGKPWECKLVREHNPDTEPCDCRISQWCAMGRSVDDPARPLSATETAEQPPAGGSGCAAAAETISGRFVVDMTETALREAARKVNAIRPGVETHTALAAINALLVMGWRPAPSPRRGDQA